MCPEYALREQETEGEGSDGHNCVFLDLNRHFSKEDIQMANKNMRRCSTLIIIREMQMKTAMSYHLTRVRMSSPKNPQTRKAGEGVEKRKPSCTVGGNAS